VSINQILRLPAPVGTLLIGHRAIFGRARDLNVHLPEHTVRTLLLEQSADCSVLAALRRFWQPWQYDPRRTNVNVRDLVDRVALLTANGTLQAHVANQRNTDRDRFTPNARRAIEQMLPQLFATPITIGAQSSKREVGISADLERLTQVIRRAADHLSPPYRQAYVRKLNKATLVTFLAALTAWVDQREGAIGLIFDSLLSGSGVVYVPSTKAQAARNLYRALEVVEKDTLATKNIEEASWWLAQAMSVHGPLELLHVVLRGTRPPPACTTTEGGSRPPPPETRRTPERYLERQRSSSATGPNIGSPAAQAAALKGAAQSGTPFCEQCAAAGRG
jgi:hypothetical protein